MLRKCSRPDCDNWFTSSLINNNSKEVLCRECRNKLDCFPIGFWEPLIPIAEEIRKTYGFRNTEYWGHIGGRKRHGLEPRFDISS